MAQYLNSGNMAGGMYSWLQIADEARCDLSSPRFNWNYQLRCKESVGNPSAWMELWPTSRFASGDPSVNLALFGQDWGEAGRFELPSTIARGAVRPWFFRGICKDSGENPLGGAVVTAYLTAGDVAVGTCACNDKGMYECPTQFYGAAHYLVARYASGNLAGATVNTLTPAL